MRSLARITPIAMAVLVAAPGARGQSDLRVSIDEALRAARSAGPEIVVARAREAVARAEVGVAGVYPNPSLAGGTSTQAAKLSGTVSIPLIIFGQRGAAMDAARADEATSLLDTQVVWNEVRRATERAFAALWLAEGVASARRESAMIETALESAVVQRVQIGSAPELDALRVHAERLRTDADVLDADARVTAAGCELGRWMGTAACGSLRASGRPAAPDIVPSLPDLLSRIGASTPVRREEADERAAEARASRERALRRPAMFLDLGMDMGDPTLPTTNYRAQLAVDVPVFNQRGAFVDREHALGEVARARAQGARVHLAAELTAAYRTFEAATARQHTLVDAVVPAAHGAAKATEDAYSLGRAQLVAVLDAERLLVDAQVSAAEAEAARADAWSDVEHALGAP